MYSKNLSLIFALFLVLLFTVESKCRKGFLNLGGSVILSDKERCMFVHSLPAALPHVK